MKVNEELLCESCSRKIGLGNGIICWLEILVWMGNFVGENSNFLESFMTYEMD